MSDARHDTTALKTQLLGRQDVPNEDIPAIIERALILKEREQIAESRLDVSDLQQVAAELDIEGHFVTKAIEQLREDTRKIAAHENLAKRKRTNYTRRAMVFTVCLAASLGVWGAFGAMKLSDAALVVETHAATLETVIERQALLLPQLMSLAGARDGELAERAKAVQGESDLEIRLGLSAALSADMAASLRGRNAKDEQDLMYELTGSQNRISTEAKRWREARAAQRAEASSLRARLAIALRFADAVE